MPPSRLVGIELELTQRLDGASERRVEWRSQADCKSHQELDSYRIENAARYNSQRTLFLPLDYCEDFRKSTLVNDWVPYSRFIGIGDYQIVEMQGTQS